MKKQDIYKLITTEKDFLDYITSEDCKHPDIIDPSESYIIYSVTPGNGKTWAALEIAKSYIDQHWDKIIWTSDFKTTEVREHLLPNLVSFGRIVEAAENMSDFNSDIRAGAATLRNELRECPFLIIDDLWVERKTQLKDTQLINYMYDIMDYRYNNRKDGLQTIITTNVKPSELSNFYNERTASRILGTCKIWEKKGVDNRIKNRQEQR